jgi:minor extracellular serine protease Vpr
VNRNYRLSRNFSILSLLLSLSLLSASAVIAGGGEKNSTVLSQFGSPTIGSPAENKMSAGLRYMLATYEAVQHAGMNAASARALYDGSLFFKLVPGRSPEAPDAPVLIKVENPTAITELERLGVKVDTRVENILVARVPITRAYEVAGLPTVNSIDIAGQSMPLLNLSRTEAKVDQVHAGTGGLTQMYKGNGVIVGVLDSGIDFAHPDFNIAAGNTRIQSILDFGNAGQQGNPTEFTKAQIDAGQCDEVDGTGGHGHGTHVSGIAVGGGRRNTAYIGMAPEADILFVKGIRDPQSNGGFGNNDVIQGVQWMFDKATTLNKPCVVNLSLGGHFGPHDGSSLYEQALSSLVKPGRIIVAAAGNEGANYIHASFAAAGTNYATAPEVLWEMPQGTTASVVDMWYPAANTLSVGIGVYTVNNNQLVSLTSTTPVAAGQSIQNQQVSYQGTVLGTVTVDASSAASNNSRNVLFVVEGNDISQYYWTVYAFGSGTFDAWVVTGGRFSPPITGLDPLIKFGDNDKSVGMPSTAKKIISVGAYVSKNSWIDINGTTQQQLNPGNPNPVVPQIGALAYFSSHGPSRDGRIKPDFAAPGEVIVSALSNGYTTVVPENVLQGGGLQKQQGTSQASPHVTGIVGLMLQRNKFLTYENVVSLLSSTATPVAVGNLWGAGKVHALNAMLATPPGVDCVMLSKITGFDCDGNKLYTHQIYPAYPNPFNPTTTIVFQMEKQQNVEVTIYDMLGRRVKTLVNEVRDGGMHNVVWDGTNDQGRQAASGVYLTRLSTGDFVASNRLMLLK